MGFDIVAQRAAVGDIQRAYLYKFYLDNVPAGAPTLMGAFGANNINLDYFNAKAFSSKRSTNVITTKWAGQTFNLSGTDNSTKQGSLQFFDNIADDEGYEFGQVARPSAIQIYDFFDALQQLTGDRASHAAALAGAQNMSATIAWINPQKTRCVRAVTYQNFKVMGVDLSEPDKASDGISMVTVDVCWDKSFINKSFIGAV